MTLVAFIGYDEPFGLSASAPHLRRLAEIIPGKLMFKYIPLEASGKDLYRMVEECVNQGASAISLPIKSEIVNSFLRLGGAKQWPDIEFMSATGALIENKYSNLHVFTDIATPKDLSLVRYNLMHMLKDAGMVFIVWQGDKLTETMTESLTNTLKEFPVTVRTYKVGDGISIDAASVDTAVDEISLQLPPPPSSSVVFHLINRLYSDDYTTKATAAGMFDFASSQVKHSSVMDEYLPVKVPIPARLYLNMQPLSGVPSSQAAAIGVPLDISEYYATPYYTGDFDAYLWAVTKGYTNGINDKQLRFDNHNVRVSYFIASISIAPGSFDYQVNEMRFNPRWWNPRADVVQ